MTTTTDNLIGLDVDVYFNLHRKMWSVRDRKTRRVVAHMDSLVLDDVTFHVSAAGNARVRAERRKNAHAFARGTVSASVEEPYGAVPVTYNPYRYTTFVEAETGVPVFGSRRAWFDGKSVVTSELDTASLAEVA